MHNHFFVKPIEKLIGTFGEKYRIVQSIESKHNLFLQKFTSVDMLDNKSRFDMTTNEIEDEIKIMNANNLNGALKKGKKCVIMSTFMVSLSKKQKTFVDCFVIGNIKAL